VEGSQYASDREREEMVGFLRDYLIAGRLTLEEFTQRVDIAYGARTAAELTRARPAARRARHDASSSVPPPMLTSICVNRRSMVSA
jgi:Domain of unknown function (DUF1707)